MIPESMKTHLISLIANNLITSEIDSIGKHFDTKFNSHLLSGEPFGITLRPEQASRVLVDFCSQRGEARKLVELIITMEDHKDAAVIGRVVTFNGMDGFLRKLESSGLNYDPRAGKLVEGAPTEEKSSWGYLKEGELYHFSFLSIDIAGNSQIQIKYPKNDIEVVYNSMYQIITKIVTKNKGKIWNWAGDGGIAAFYLDDKVKDAVRCAFEIQLNMVMFNLQMDRNRFAEPIRLRIAGHDGLTVYKENKGTILSEAINYVAHLEKGGTLPNSISISRSMYDNLDERLKKVFTHKGVFEDIDYYNVNLAFEWLQF